MEIQEKNTIIELAQSDDFHRIATIYNEYISLGTATMQETLHDAKMIGQWVTDFNNREKLYTLKKDEIVIGWGIIKQYSDREGYRFACETAVYLTQNELRKGYGSLMKRFIISVCKTLNYKHLVAKIFASNTASIGYPSNVGSFTTAQKSGSKAGTVRTTLLPLFWAVVKLYQHLQP
jgi:phosphinothricin acetyltransferase